MNRLLASNFSRLKKNKVFWAEMVFMFAIGSYLVGNKYYEHVTYGYEVRPEMGFFGYSIVAGVAEAVFASLFLGTEYSDGTLRNKLIIGYSRSRIYFADLITVTAVSLLLSFCFVVPSVAVGIPLLGCFTIGMEAFLWMMAGTVLLAAAFGAIFTMFSLVCSSKSASAVGSLLLVLALFIAAGAVNAKLDQPEYSSFYSLSESGEMELHTEPNPEFLTGTKREVYQFFYDFLPTGQAIQYAGMSAVHLRRMPVYSLLIAAGVTAAGLRIFRKKDIR